MRLAEAAPLSPIGAWHPPDLSTGPDETQHAIDASAYQRAWHQGHAAAMAETEATMQVAVQACLEAERQLFETREVLREQFTHDVRLLAIGIARHLLEREFIADPALLQRLVARALELAPLSGTITIRLHPEDLAEMRRTAAFPEIPVAGVEARWVPDADMVRGGCAIETPTAMVDGRIDRALLDIHEQLAHE